MAAVGDKHNRLAIIFGPLSFDHSDAEVQRLVASAFAIALKQKVAIGFHLDDSMFWARRSDLWRNPDNVEWLDWNGTPTTGRRIDWGPQPKKIPPQMCFNSKAIQAEVRRRAAEVIGKAIKAGVDQLRRQGKEDLFAGVIAGWETQIGQDFDTGRYLGYHALANRGFSKNHPPRDMDGEREKIVAGVHYRLVQRACGRRRFHRQDILAHGVSVATAIRQDCLRTPSSYSEHNHFAPPSVAFGKFHRPGFSTYPQPGLFEQIYHGSGAAWASGLGFQRRHEPAAWQRAGTVGHEHGDLPGEDVQSWRHAREYLLVGRRRRGEQEDGLSRGDGGEEALNAYRKFLRGERLVETVSATSSYLERLPGKNPSDPAGTAGLDSENRESGAGRTPDAAAGCRAESQ